ncbi:hypothetical protein VT03_07575 [Planctomyces sp. SH-PL14]|nr:hypothetical protein VT03_07575 [Planctomyces sp. SH-PL14]
MTLIARLTFVVFGLAVAAAPVAQAAEKTVRLTKGQETVKVTIGDEVFTVLNYQPKWKKPFFLPVTAEGGLQILKDEIGQPADEPGAPGNKVLVVSEGAEVRDGGKVVGKLAYWEVLTVDEVKGNELHVPDKKGWVQASDVVPLKATVSRLINENPPAEKNSKSPLYYDHPHHKGIWFSIDEVNKIKFWAEQGTIRTAGVEIVKAEGNPAVLRYTSHWLGADEKPVLTETTTVQIFPNRLMAFDFVLTAAVPEVEFEDTKEGLFAIRVPNSMRESISGGPVVNADGLKGTKECWGKTSSWVDYVGPIGSRTFGITLMDGPKNFHKSRYHVRDYGLFSMSPFGDKSYSGGKVETPPVHLKKDESLRLRYGLYVHDGDSEKGGVPAVYNQFAELP